MENKTNKWIYFTIIGLLLIVSAFFLYESTNELIDAIKTEKEIKEIGKDYRERIDSLQESINRLDKEIKNKEDQEAQIEIRWKIEKEKIKYLPLDSSVLLLKQNLEEYENENNLGR